MVYLSALVRFQHIKKEVTRVIFDVVGDEMKTIHFATEHVLEVVFKIRRGFVDGFIDIFFGERNQVKLRL